MATIEIKQKYSYHYNVYNITYDNTYEANRRITEIATELESVESAIRIAELFTITNPNEEVEIVLVYLVI